MPRKICLLAVVTVLQTNRSCRVPRIRKDRLRRDRRIAINPGGYGQAAPGACPAGKHQAWRMARLCRPQQPALLLLRQGWQAGEPALISWQIDGCDCREGSRAEAALPICFWLPPVVGSFFLAPAVLYVLILVGLPLLLAV